MGVDNYNSSIERSVWVNKNGSRVMSVSSLLTPGKYDIDKEETDEGIIILKAKPLE